MTIVYFEMEKIKRILKAIGDSIECFSPEEQRVMECHKKQDGK